MLVFFIKKLDPLEIRRFKDFLKSPYHNKNKSLVLFFNAIIQYYPDFEDKKFTSINIYKKVYGRTQKFKAKTIANLMSALKRVLESYFIYAEVSLERKIELELGRKAAIRRNYKKSILFYTDDLEKRIEDEKIKTDQHYLNLMQIQDDAYTYLLGDLKKSEAQRYLTASMENLDRFYWMKKLDFSLRFYNWKSVFGVDREIFLLKETLEYGTTDLERENLLFRIYSLGIAMYQNPGAEVFRELNDIFLENHTELPLNQQSLILGLLANFASKEMQRDEDKYKYDLFGLFEFRIRENLLLQDGRISDTNFINAVAVAVSCGYFDWANQFRFDYMEYLGVKQKDNILNFTQAFIFFFEKRYNEAIERLNQTYSRTILFELRFRSLWIRTHYERWLSGEEELYNVLEYVVLLKRFVNNKKGKEIRNQTTIEAYGNFCKVCIMLCTEKSKEELMETIKPMEYLVCRSWLETKIPPL